MKVAPAGILLLLAFALVVVEPTHAFTCIQVETCLTPCLTYLTGQQPAPTPGCCDGVRRLKNMGITPAERQFACNCVKHAAAHFPNLKDDAVSDLPRLCATPLPFPISLEFDCSKIPN
ncbi:hypothetical protein C4D60_Mb05t00540 [Musa balbisiana]|uniref:Bifunctional inhibitor/plant lipid transfer protein/seed storage helical domain-containing protein n=1 Tax=Musa balbisiana TaxID=52838 RepID=A0A4S8JSP8_MUSBA|nr:hypothetical protein C4D60_Mb05t00540 [Musa balbisiana]